MEQGQTAFHGQACFFLGRDDLQLKAGFRAHPFHEFPTIAGLAAGLGGDAAAAGGSGTAYLFGADHERANGARHGRLGERSGGLHALAETHNAGEGIDDTECSVAQLILWIIFVLIFSLGHQQAAVIGAEIERREGRLRGPCRRARTRVQ